MHQWEPLALMSSSEIGGLAGKVRNNHQNERVFFNIFHCVFKQQILHFLSVRPLMITGLFSRETEAQSGFLNLSLYQQFRWITSGDFHRCLR